MDELAAQLFRRRFAIGLVGRVDRIAEARVQRFIEGGKAPELKSSVGAAVDLKAKDMKAASIGSMEDLARSNWLAAMNDPARQQVNLLSNIDKNIQAMAAGQMAGAAAGRARDQVNRGLLMQQGLPS